MSLPKPGIPKAGIPKTGIPKTGIPKTGIPMAPLIQTPLRLPLNGHRVGQVHGGGGGNWRTLAPTFWESEKLSASLFVLQNRLEEEKLGP